MAYSKTTWQDRDVITAAKLNNLEAGVETNDTAVTACLKKSEAESNYLKKTDAESTYAKKGAQISSEDATDDASSATVDPAEFTKVVTLLNEIKTALNTMNGFGA